MQCWLKIPARINDDSLAPRYATIYQQIQQQWTEDSLKPLNRPHYRDRKRKFESRKRDKPIYDVIKGFICICNTRF